ncbi:MAG: hypothetical protein KIT27_02090 [Legionellales bacterium]|nr:hypothetical protein [Legionellales bacterium]
MSQHSLFEKIIPFIALGITIAIAIFLFIVGLYILFYGALIGLIIFTVVFLKNKLFGSSNKLPRESAHSKTYDHDEFKNS